VNEISPLLIERYKKLRKNEIRAMKKNEGKQDRDVSFTSINRELALLKHFYSKANEWGVFDKNPAKFIKMFPEKLRERYLNEEEISCLLEACEKNKNRHLKVIVITALNTAQG